MDHASRAVHQPERCCTTEGVLAACDGRKFVKAVCCCHAIRRAGRRQHRHGQPAGHYRCAGLLSEALPRRSKLAIAQGRSRRDPLLKAAEAPAWQTMQSDSTVVAAAKEEIETINPIRSIRRTGKGTAVAPFGSIRHEAHALRCGSPDNVLIARGARRRSSWRRWHGGSLVVARQLDACEGCEAIGRGGGGDEGHITLH